MLIPIIKVKDGDYTHVVGTNSHDMLYVDEETGGIQYHNLQCCEGTKKYGQKEEDTINFVGEQNEWHPWAVVEMVEIEELIEIATKNMVKQTEASIRLHESFKKYLEEKELCEEKRKGDDVVDTSGMLF